MPLHEIAKIFWIDTINRKERNPFRRRNLSIFRVIGYNPQTVDAWIDFAKQYAIYFNGLFEPIFRPDTISGDPVSKLGTLYSSNSSSGNLLGVMPSEKSNLISSRVVRTHPAGNLL
jgi:hypothetical protein